MLPSQKVPGSGYTLYSGTYLIPQGQPSNTHPYDIVATGRGKTVTNTFNSWLKIPEKIIFNSWLRKAKLYSIRLFQTRLAVSRRGHEICQDENERQSICVTYHSSEPRLDRHALADLEWHLIISLSEKRLFPPSASIAICVCRLNQLFITKACSSLWSLLGLDWILLWSEVSPIFLFFFIFCLIFSMSSLAPRISPLVTVKIIHINGQWRQLMIHNTAQSGLCSRSENSHCPSRPLYPLHCDTVLSRRRLFTNRNKKYSGPEHVQLGVMENSNVTDGV